VNKIARNFITLVACLLPDPWPTPFIIFDRETAGTFHAFVTYKHAFQVGFAWPVSQMFVHDELKMLLNIVLHVKDCIFLFKHHKMVFP
jgi:hypothetical protein